MNQSTGLDLHGAPSLARVRGSSLLVSWFIGLFIHLKEDGGGGDKTSMGSSSELVSSSSDNPLPAEYPMETSPQPESLVRLMALFGMRAKEAQVSHLLLEPCLGPGMTQ